MAPALEALAARAKQAGPVPAEIVWTLARQTLEALATDPQPDPGALRSLGETIWLALTGDSFAAPGAGEHPSWARLDAAEITPDFGMLPVLLTRTLVADPTQPPVTAASLLDTLNMLANLRLGVPGWPDMPSRAPVPDPAPAAAAEERPSASAERELWTRPPAHGAALNRRLRVGSDVWNTLILLVAGGLAGFFGGVLYEKTYGLGTGSASVATPAVTAQNAAPVTPAPELPLPPSPAVGLAAVAARVERIKTLQPDVGTILRYARQMRRVATVPVGDGSYFPSESQFSQLIERFDWQQPDSPNFHRTPLLLVLGYARAQSPAQQCADQMAQVLRKSGLTLPIYACGLGEANTVPEVENTGIGGDGRGVEVWVAFTLF